MCTYACTHTHKTHIYLLQIILKTRFLIFDFLGLEVSLVLYIHTVLPLIYNQEKQWRTFIFLFFFPAFFARSLTKPWILSWDLDFTLSLHLGTSGPHHILRKNKCSHFPSPLLDKTLALICLLTKENFKLSKTKELNYSAHFLHSDSKSFLPFLFFLEYCFEILPIDTPGWYANRLRR